MKFLIKFKWPFVLILICVIILGVRSIRNQPVQAENTPLAQTVAVQAVSKAPKENVLALAGNVDACNSLVISPKYGGKVSEIAVDNGDRVSSGQTLVVMDDVQQANAKLTSQSTLTKAQANLSNVQKTYDQMCALLAGGAVSQNDVDKAKLALDSATADVEAATAAFSNASDAYTDTRIHSTINGLVAGKTVKVGQVVAAGTPLMTVQDITSVYVVVKVSQESIARIKPGLTAEVTVDTYPEKKFPGKVAIVSPVADSQSRSFEVKILVANPDSALKPGMSAQVRISLGAPLEVIAVPQTAVSGKEGLYYVFIAEDNQAKRQTVEIGDTMQDKIEITSGLQTGQQLIITKVNKLKDGDRIQIAGQQ